METSEFLVNRLFFYFQMWYHSLKAVFNNTRQDWKSRGGRWRGGGAQLFAKIQGGGGGVIAFWAKYQGENAISDYIAFSYFFYFFSFLSHLIKAYKFEKLLTKSYLGRKYIKRRKTVKGICKPIRCEILTHYKCGSNECKTSITQNCLIEYRHSVYETDII